MLYRFLDARTIRIVDFAFPEPKRAHLRDPAFKNTTKTPREDLQESEERKKVWRERGKRATFWAVRVRAVLERAVLGRAVGPPPLPLPICAIKIKNHNCNYNYNYNCFIFVIIIVIIITNIVM